MFSNDWLSYFIQLLVLIPSAISCYLPAKNQMKFSMKKTVLIICSVVIPVAFTAASLSVLLVIDINIVMLPVMIVFFFLYRLTVNFDLSRALAIYVGVCAIQTFPSQFATVVDMYLSREAANLTVRAAFIQLGLSFLLLALFIYPARNHFSKAVDEPGLAKIWYFTVVLSSIFLVLNLIAVPRSYDLMRESRLQYLFPIFEIFSMLILITIYMLFYRGAVAVSEQSRLERRSQLLEMQTRQFRELREYMRQNARLRHDFRQSVRLLGGLAEKGDLDSIKSHLAEYEQRFSESVSVNYCSNAALNALFAYYQETADSEGIKTDWKIELPDPLTVSELDMAAMFGNLMENAIEACLTLPAIPEGQRYFSLTSEIRQPNDLYVVSTNSFDGNVRKNKDGYCSVKHTGTGTGLISITAVAEKYGGTVRAYNSDKEFFVDVVMKI